LVTGYGSTWKLARNLSTTSAHYFKPNLTLLVVGPIPLLLEPVEWGLGLGPFHPRVLILPFLVGPPVVVRVVHMVRLVEREGEGEEVRGDMVRSSC
jgi:hypothetical protein